MGLVDAHQFFLDDIATAVGAGGGLTEEMELSVRRLTYSKISSNQLPEIEKKLVDSLLDLLSASNPPEGDGVLTNAEAAWRKAIILAGAISTLRDRQENPKPNPKPKKKPARAPSSPMPIESAEPLVLAGAKG